MSFLQSAINQVGRDMGRAVSKQILQGANQPQTRPQSQQNATRRRATKSDFEKAINFPTGHKPNTLITKITGAFSAMKTEVNSYLSDGYLDTDESDNLFIMFNAFNEKCGDICEIFELDEENNGKEIEQLSKVLDKSTELFKNALIASADGCRNKKQELLSEAQDITDLDFVKFVGFSALWMGNYAKTGNLSVGKVILANFLSLFIIPFAHIFAGVLGIAEYSKENNRRKEHRQIHYDWANLEEIRAEKYQEIAEGLELNL